MAFSIHHIYARVSPLFRRRRMRNFATRLCPTAATRILDVGGYPGNWKETTLESSITILNVGPLPSSPGSDRRIETVVGDGCQLQYGDESFDIVFSNSVIEHVGSFERQQAFAREVRRVGKALWIQTPARSFFIEPHLLTPFIHFLPRTTQRRLLRHFTVWGLLTKPTAQQVDDFMEQTRLLDKSELKQLFPDCDILEEHIAGLTKSFIALRKTSPELS